jgi:Protein of unknown function (DUF3570)
VKRKYIVFGLLAAASLNGFAQRTTDSLYRLKKVAKTDIQLVYSQYIQNGNHSAITGGVGTQKLLVYAPEMTLKRQIDSGRSYSLNAGLDVITSASLDNIDYVVSSASRVSKRGFVDISYTKGNPNKGISLAPSAYLSAESAYLSYGLGFTIDHVSKDKSREMSANIETFFDDLRLGRFNGKRPFTLVYPVELRYKQWFSQYLRQSYNLSLEFQQSLNNRMQLGFFPGFSYQHGLLATPYHRVYFTDSTERVENLPPDRFKIPLGLQLNSFIGARSILQTYYRFYWDNFGIIAHSLDVSLAFKLSPAFTISPLVRWYVQTASFYFKPYRDHLIQENYYTSNYDLSAFTSYEAGLEARFSGGGKTGQGNSFSELALRYSYYRRTDGLYSHILTLLTGIASRGKPRTPNPL